MQTINILYSADKPVISTHNAGEIGENRAVVIKAIPEAHPDVAMYTMYFAVEGGILPSRVFDVDEDIEIALTTEMTQAEILPCQLVGVSADGESVITKTPIIELHLGESIVGDVVVDPKTGDTIFNEIAELKGIADKLDLTVYYKKDETYSREEVDALLWQKPDREDVYTKLETDALLVKKANVSDVYATWEIDRLLNGKASTEALTDLDRRVLVNSQHIEQKADLIHYHNDEYYNKGFVDEKLALKADKTELKSKADVGASYTKAETDTLLTAKASAKDIPTKVSQLLNDSNYVKESSLKTVAFTGNYDNLINKPTKLSQFTNDITVEIPKASETVLGGIKVGNNLTIDDAGYLDAVVPDISGKQDKLTAGDNITIDGNVISATGGGESNVFIAGDDVTWDELVDAYDDGKFVVHYDGNAWYTLGRRTNSTAYFVNDLFTYEQERILGTQYIARKGEYIRRFTKANGWTDAVQIFVPTLDDIVGLDEYEDISGEVTKNPDKRIFSAGVIQEYYATKDYVYEAIGNVESLLEALL